LRSRSYYLESD